MIHDRSAQKVPPPPPPPPPPEEPPPPPPLEPPPNPPPPPRRVVRIACSVPRENAVRSRSKPPSEKPPCPRYQVGSATRIPWKPCTQRSLTPRASAHGRYRCSVSAGIRARRSCSARSRNSRKPRTWASIFAPASVRLGMKRAHTMKTSPLTATPAD